MSSDSFLLDSRVSEFSSLLAQMKEKCGHKCADLGDTCQCQDRFTFMLTYLKANIPIRYLNMVIDDPIYTKICREFDPTTGQFVSAAEPIGSNPTVFDGYKSLFNAYIANLDGTVAKNGYSFVFTGFNESGKTHAAIHILSKAISKGLSGYYILLKDLYLLHNASAYDRHELEQKLYNHINNCDFLVIDEVGKESFTDNAVVAVEGIIKGRTSANKPTILVTNLDFDRKAPTGETINEFESRYGQSVYSSIKQDFRVIQFSKNGMFRTKLREDWSLPK